MQRLLRIVLALVTLSTLPVTGLAAGYELHCPESIRRVVPTVPAKLQTVPQGWEVAAKGSEFLRLDASVALYNGKPVERVQLKPELRTIAGTTQQSWLVRKDYDPEQRGYWLSCSYGGGQVELIHLIDPGMTLCWSKALPDAQHNASSTLQCSNDERYR